MSSSTIFIKQPLNYRRSLAVIKNKVKEYSPYLWLLLWTFSGFYAAARSKFNPNITGLTVSFDVFDILLMFLSCISVYKGIDSKNMTMIFPWMFMSLYTMYDHHYLGLMNTLKLLKPVKKLSWLPWTNLIGNATLLVIRATLMIRMFQLCIHFWFQKKLKELRKLGS